jgi:hypothetical protein
MLAIAITLLLVHLPLRSRNLVHSALKGLEFGISRGVVGVGVCENLPGSQRFNLGKGCLPQRGGVRFYDNLEEANLDYSKCHPREAQK